MKWPYLLAAALLLALGAAGAGVWRARTLLPCLQPDSVEINRYCLEQATMLEPLVRLAAKLTNRSDLTIAVRILQTFTPFLGWQDYLLGIGRPEPTTYLVLLQNDNELRANGGFAGSYAVVTAQDGKFTVRFQDIYVPDGQISGHVDPPAPIQAAFGQGWWKLRDSDWYPDFPSSAQTIRWFFRHGKEIDPDFLLTLNLKTLQQVLAVTGPLEVPQYQISINQHNLYQNLQTFAEVGFFPGSTQKKDALAAVGRALINKIDSLDTGQKLNLVSLFLDQLDQSNILVNAQDSQFEDVLLAKNWAGQLSAATCATPGCINDTLAVIETNLGANKANCCVSRLTNHLITTNNDYLIHQVTLGYTNTALGENPQPPDFYGGNYIQYLRFYLPLEATFVDVGAVPTLPTTLSRYPKPYTDQKNLLTTAEVLGFKEIGFFHITQAGTTSTVRLSYSLPLRDSSNYQLTLLKQHGLTNSPQVVYFEGKQYQTELHNDFKLAQTLP